MSAFDAEIAVLSATVSTPTDEAIEDGASAQLELGIFAGLALPVPNPQTGQPLVIPIGKFRFGFDRETAIALFEAALAAAKTLPEAYQPSGKVMVAQNMSEVARAAAQMKNVTGT